MNKNYKGKHVFLDFINFYNQDNNITLEVNNNAQYAFKNGYVKR